MKIDSPDHAAVPPRAAATTLIVRDADAGLEVLMVRRSPHASFMPGAYVFPGGAVDTADAAPEALALCDETDAALHERIGRVTEVGALGAAYAVAALRECFEECGLWLGAPDHHADAAAWSALRLRLHAGESLAALAAGAGLTLATSRLQPWSHWVTPAGLPKRFDTLFFVCRAPLGQTPEVDATETTTLAWVQPQAALAAQARGEFQMEFATRSTVQSMLPFVHAGAAALLAHAAAQRTLPALHPRLQRDTHGRRIGVLLPGEPGYEDAA